MSLPSTAVRVSRSDEPADASRVGSDAAAPHAEPTGILTVAPAADPLTVLVVVPTLEAGAAEAGAIELARILAAAGHRPIVVSRGGRQEADVPGGAIVRLDVASKNPVRIIRNAIALARLVRARGCDVIHAHGRTAAWSAYLAARMTGVPLLTTWHKGFREQNPLKHLYNSVMVRGTRVIAVSDQIAELINNRYGTPWDRIAVVPASIDVRRFDPALVSRERIEAVRRAWGVSPETRVMLVVGRMLRRKGHHVVVKAAQRLKAMGLKDFLCVFAGAEQRHTRYGDELWDLVLATDTADVVRLGGAVDDVPAVYAAAALAISAAIQPEGMQRALLEAQAMARPVVVSDVGAGPEVVLAPPAVPEGRMTGLRFATGDDWALAATLVRLLSMPEQVQRTMGERGRAWVLGQFNTESVAEQTLDLYAEIARTRRRP